MQESFQIREFETLRKYISRYKTRILIGCSFVVITNLLGVLGPWVLKYAIDGLGASLTTELLARYAAMIVGIALAEGIFRFLMRKTIIGVSRHIEYDLRNDFFGHLQCLSLSFFNRSKTGELMALATNDLEAVRQAAGPAIMYSLNALVSMVCLVVMLSLDWELALLSMVPFPFMAVTVQQLARRLNKAHRKIQAQYATITAKVQENLSGIRIVKAYAQEEGESMQFRGLNKDFIDRNMSMIKIRGLMTASMSLLLGMGSLIVLWAGGRKVISGTLTLGEFVAFFSYLSILTWPMIAVGWVINLFQQGAASMGRLNRVFEIEPDVRDDVDTDNSICDLQGSVEFRNVSFAYGDRPVLKNINLTVENGSTVAIVGPTGSGKSTLISLVPRLLEPQQGSVLIGGHPINKIPLEVLRRAIGYVPQDTFLFSDTISANIEFGVENAAIEQILEASESSQVRKDIEDFPNGFNTLLGERGINISGGQKQRTAIARAIIRNPRILILDDSMSAVDTSTEEAILKRLRQIMKQRTSFIVSHRVSTVKHADLILYFDDGEIIERGTHDELIARDGAYAELHEQQLLEEALESF